MKRFKKFVVFLLAICMMFSFSMVTYAAVKKSITVKEVGKEFVVKNYKKVKSNKKSVLSVKSSGKNKFVVTPKKVGEATLTYYNKKGKAVKKVYVLVTNKNSFKYDNSDVQIKKGKSLTVKCKVYKKCKVKYSSSNKRIATVSKTGKITGKNYGKSTISAKIYYKGKLVKTFKKKVEIVKKVTKPNSQNQVVKPTPETETNAPETETKVPETETKVPETETKVPETNVPETETNVPETESKEPENKVYLKSISCSVSKTSINVGDSYKKEYIRLIGTYSDGSTSELTNFTFNLETTKAGVNKLVITCNDVTPAKIFNVDITVKEKEVAKKTGIRVISNVGNEVEYGYNFSKNDFTVYDVYSDGSEKLASTWSYSANYDGVNCTVTITSDNVEPVILIFSSPKPVESQQSKVLKKVVCKVKKDWVYLNESVDRANVVMVATYTVEGKTVEEEVKDFTMNFAPSSIVTDANLKVMWKDKEFNFVIRVLDSEPASFEYHISYNRSNAFFDEILDESDISVYKLYTDNTKEIVTNYTVTFTPASEIGKWHTVVAHVDGHDLTINIPTVDRNDYSVLKVILNDGDIAVGDVLNETYFDVTAETLDGRTVDVTDYELSWKSKSSPGTYDLVISAKGVSITLEMNVV